MGKVNHFSWATVVVVTLCGLKGLADEVSISVDVSKTSVRVAEPFSVEFSLTAPRGTRVNFPEVPSTFGEFEVLGYQDLFDIPNQKKLDARTWTRQLTLESLVAGELVVPSLEIQTQFDSKKQIVRTDKKKIQVVSVLENRVDPLSFRDIKSVVDVDIPKPVSYAWLGWIIGGMAGLGVFSVAVAKIAIRKKWVTPQQWAISELGTLRQSCALEVLETEAVFAQLEIAIKVYLEAQFGIPATKQTANQLVGNIAFADETKDLESKLVKLLDAAEQAKYAGWELPSSELTEAIDDAIELIRALDSTIIQSGPTPANSPKVWEAG